MASLENKTKKRSEETLKEAGIVIATCSFTTLSKASTCEKSVGTCWTKCCHHVGDENLWMIATEQRSKSTGGTTVGSDNIVAVKMNSLTCASRAYLEY